MTPEEFVHCFKAHKEELKTLYWSDSGDTSVAKKIQSLNLTLHQKTELGEIIDDVLTDTFYSILLGLDGSASIGSVQQGYTILDENGSLIASANDGSLAAAAYGAFNEQSD